MKKKGRKEGETLTKVMYQTGPYRLSVSTSGEWRAWKQLGRKADKDGKEQYSEKTIGFYSSMPAAASKLCEHIAADKAQDLQEYVSIFQAEAALLYAMLDGVMEAKPCE